MKSWLSAMANGTLVKQLKDGRWEAQVGLIKMTLEEKEFNLIKAEKEGWQPKKRQVNVVKRSNTSGERVWTSRENAMKRPCKS